MRGERYQARAAGLLTYTTGRPCSHGHVGERYTSNGKCLACCFASTHSPGKAIYDRLRRERIAITQGKAIPRLGVRKYATAEQARLAKNARDKALRATPEGAKASRAKYKRQYPARKARLKTDIQFRLSVALRNRLSTALRRKYKTGSAVRDLGCSIAEFKHHIEQQFSGRMTWENYGRVWVLDHRRPLSQFDLSDRAQFLQAAHFTNYQPLSPKANGAKRARRLFLV